MLSYLESDLERDFAAASLPSEAQNPILPPLHTVYYIYTVLIHTGNGEMGRVIAERRGEGLKISA
jgi:hypothetical protein